MATNAASGPETDFTIHTFPKGLSTTLSRSKGKKMNWFVSSNKPNALWYSIIIGNLHSEYAISEDVTMADIRRVIEAGIKRSAFDRLKDVIQSSSADLGKVVRIPSRTLSRRTVFHPDESERILRVAAVFQKTIEVFEDLEKARRWFSASRSALGGSTPLQFCDTEVGAEEVMDLLGRIEQGIFS